MFSMEVVRSSITTPINIYLLDMNFEKFTVRLHFLLKSLTLAKFSENQRLITMSLIKYLNFKFLQSKMMHK